MPFLISVLDPGHDRVAFNCGNDLLDRYFRQQVTQDTRRRIATCFVATVDKTRVAGYYTLSATSVMLTDLPDGIGRRLPRYPTVPAARMGRLAIDRAYQGQGLGGALLADALDRVARSEIAAYALIVDAKNDTAAAFYLHHSFIAFPASPRTLFLPITTVVSSG